MTEILLELVGPLERRRQQEHELRSPSSQAIKSARLDQLFNRRPTHHSVINALTKVQDVFEGAFGFSSLNNFLSRTASQAFDGDKTEENAAIDHREIRLVRVDIGRQDIHAQPAGI